MKENKYKLVFFSCKYRSPDWLCIKRRWFWVEGGGLREQGWGKLAIILDDSRGKQADKKFNHIMTLGNAKPDYLEAK